MLRWISLQASSIPTVPQCRKFISLPERHDTNPIQPIKQAQANSYLRTGPEEEMQLVDELDFESAKVGATESDAEEEAEAAAREEQEEQRQREELERRKAEILNSTTTQTFVLQA